MGKVKETRSNPPQRMVDSFLGCRLARWVIWLWGGLNVDVGARSLLEAKKRSSNVLLSKV